MGEKYQVIIQPEAEECIKKAYFWAKYRTKIVERQEIHDN